MACDSDQWRRFQTGARHLACAAKWGRLAQLVEQLTLNQRVVGSNPSASTILLVGGRS
jgi:hypothetical protein